MVSYFVVRHRNHVLLSTPKYEEYKRFVDQLWMRELIVEIRKKVKK